MLPRDDRRWDFAGKRDCIEAEMTTRNKTPLVQGTIYIAAGMNHFWHPDFYVHLMPDHYRDPRPLVLFTGLAEMAGGVGLLVPATRKAAAIGLVAMLTGFFDVHIYMLQHPERFPAVPKWALWARIPLQFVLMAWAARYARSTKAQQNESPRKAGR